MVCLRNICINPLHKRDDDDDGGDDDDNEEEEEELYRQIKDTLP